MLRRILCLLALFGVGCADGGGAKSVFAKAAPSIIVVIGQDADGKPISQGSGVVIGEGVAITNCHVIEGAAKVRVRQAADAQAEKSYLMDAEVTTRDEVRDLCLLHVPDLTKPPAAKVAKIGSAEGLAVGEEVYAIGAPQGLDLSLSRGIVAQLRSGLSGTKGKAPLVQTDAATSPGSSGGGLFNNKGELVGITTFKRTGGENLNFAMPVEDIAELTQANAAQQECAAQPNYQCVMALAEQAVQKISNIYEHAVALRVIAQAQMQAGDLQGAKKVLVDASQSAQQINTDNNTRRGISARNEILFGIAVVQAKVGDIQGAKHTAQQISYTSNLVEALNGIASVQAKSGNITGAKQAFAEAVQIAQQGGDFWRDEMLANIAVAQAKAGDVKGAKQAAQQIARADKRDEMLRGIASIQAKAGDITDAKQTAQQINSNYERAKALIDIAVEQARVDNAKSAKPIFVEAVKVAQQISNDNYRNNTLKNIALAQAKVGDIKNAKQTAHQGNPYGLTYRLADIAVIQAQAGDMQGAKQSFADAVQSTKNVFGKWINLHYVIYAQIKVGDIKSARQTAEQINVGFRRDQALESIAIAQVQAGDIQSAKQSVEQIGEEFRAARALKNVTYAQTHCADCFVLSVSDGITYEIQTTQTSKAKSAKQVAWQIATAQAQEGNFGEAMRMAKSMNNFHKTVALAGIAKALAAKNAAVL